MIIDERYGIVRWSVSERQDHSQEEIRRMQSMSNHRHRMGQALAPFILFAIVAPGCADKPVPVRKEQPQALTAQVRAPATIPERLRGVWYVDDTDGRASCRKYLTADPATIERTGADPLVGAVVISSRIVHHYSEYGEGDFFLVDTASPVTRNAWQLSGNVSADSFSEDDEYGVDSSERFELSNDGTKLSISDGTGRTLSRCGDVRNDLYSIDSADETHVAEKEIRPNETNFPTNMLGTGHWVMRLEACLSARMPTA